MFKNLITTLVISLAFAGVSFAGGCPTEYASIKKGVMMEYGISQANESQPVRVWLDCKYGQCNELSIMSRGEVRTVKLLAPVSAVYGANINAVGIIQPNGERVVVTFGKPNSNGECYPYLTDGDGYRGDLYGIKYTLAMRY